VVDKSRYPSVGGPVVGINYAQGIGEIIGFTNFLVTIITPIAVLVIVAAGIMYMTAGTNAENQEKAKRMATLALVSLVLVYGAFAVISTVISGQFDSSAPAENPAAAVETPNIVNENVPNA
jgi:cytochrome bd-type quinol oxidase subunit 2